MYRCIYIYMYFFYVPFSKLWSPRGPNKCLVSLWLLFKYQLASLQIPTKRGPQFLEFPYVWGGGGKRAHKGVHKGVHKVRSTFKLKQVKENMHEGMLVGSAIQHFPLLNWWIRLPSASGRTCYVQLQGIQQPKEPEGFHL